MKKVCGIELKGSEAQIVILEGTFEDYKVIPLPFDKLKIDDSRNQTQVKDFHTKVLAFFKEQDFAEIALKERMPKGRFAGGSMSFKMEGLIQTSDYEIRLIHGATIKSKLKDLEYDTELVKKAQGEAFKVALFLLLGA